MVVGLIVVVGCGSKETDGPTSTGVAAPNASRFQPELEATPSFVGEPSQDQQITIEDANKIANDGEFRIAIPDSSYANAENLTAAYEQGRGVLMAFPPPNDHSDDLRQPQLTVFFGPWRGGNIEAFNAEDIKADPDVGKNICHVGSATALCVSARSPSDAEKANPVYVRVVDGETVLEVSGGDDLDAALDVAQSVLTKIDASE